MEGSELCPWITSRTITRHCSVALPRRVSAEVPCSSRSFPPNIAVDLNQKDKWLHFDNSTFLAGHRAH